MLLGEIDGVTCECVYLVLLLFLVFLIWTSGSTSAQMLGPQT